MFDTIIGMHCTSNLLDLVAWPPIQGVLKPEVQSYVLLELKHKHQKQRKTYFSCIGRNIEITATGFLNLLFGMEQPKPVNYYMQTLYVLPFYNPYSPPTNSDSAGMSSLCVTLSGDF